MKHKIVAALSFCLAVLWLQSAAGQPASPTERVRAMLENVMAVQADPQLQARAQKRTAIKKIIARNFDFDAMARNALDPHWKKLTEAERSEFKGVFQDLFQNSYTKLVLDFLKKETIAYNGEQKLSGGGSLVKTVITRPNEEIPVDYTMAAESGSWLVQDVAIDGVSIVSNYNKSFSRIIQKESYASLLKRMRLQQRAIEKSP